MFDMICVFTGGDLVEPKLCEEFFKNHKKTEKIKAITADSGLFTYEKFQEHFGFFELVSVLGDWDSLCEKNADKTILQKYPKEIIENHIVDKDYTDTELALEKAHFEKREEKIVLIGAGGGKRIDHLLAVYDIFSTNLRPDIWISGEQFLYYLPQNSSTKIYNLGKYDIVSVLRATYFREGGKVESKGFKWESDLFRKDGIPSISNRIDESYFEQNKPIEIKITEKDFILFVPYFAFVIVVWYYFGSN